VRLAWEQMTSWISQVHTDRSTKMRVEVVSLQSSHRKLAGGPASAAPTLQGVTTHRLGLRAKNSRVMRLFSYLPVGINRLLWESSKDERTT
jgi:hypothetical protein